MIPVLSVVTSTRNRPERFRKLVRSIVEHTSVTYEIVVSDASDVPVSCDLADIRILPERPRLGFSKGMNVACRAAKGKWTLILNDDCEVLPGYAEAAVSFMEHHPQIGIGALPYSNKGGPFRTNSNSFDGMLYANFPILSTELGNRVGWHDEAIRMYGADNSLGFRVLLAGFGIAEIPGARILHHEHEDLHRQENLRGQMEDAERLRAKYEPLLAQMREVYERCRLVTV